MYISVVFIKLNFSEVFCFRNLPLKPQKPSIWNNSLYVSGTKQKALPNAMSWCQHSAQSYIRHRICAGVCRGALFHQNSGSTMIFTDHHFIASCVSETADYYEITMKWLKPQLCSMWYTTYSLELGCRRVWGLRWGYGGWKWEFVTLPTA